MKIRTTTTITEIEADARDLRESNTLAQNFAMFMSRCFQNCAPFEGDAVEEPDNEEDQKE